MGGGARKLDAAPKQPAGQETGGSKRRALLEDQARFGVLSRHAAGERAQRAKGRSGRKGAAGERARSRAKVKEAWKASECFDPARRPWRPPFPGARKRGMPILFWSSFFR